MNYSKYLTSTPQTEPIPGLKQVKNNAGGYVFEVNWKTLLNRFLLTGTTGGTYYVSERKLTVENATAIITMIKNHGMTVVNTTLDSLLNFKAPKADPALFVMALAATYGTPEVKAFVYNNVYKFCKTSTNLFTFIEEVNELRGWSRGLRTAVSRFYTTKTPDQLAYQVIKYRQRNGWSHRDVFRLAHPDFINSGPLPLDGVARDRIASYVIGKDQEGDFPTKLIVAYEFAKIATVTELVTLIKDNENLTWEMIPTEMLNNPLVLKALLPKMPLTALMRNLNRFSKAGVFETRLDEGTLTAIRKLTDEKQIEKAGLHPVNILNTLFTYSSGRGFRGSETWPVNQVIVEALNTTLEMSYKYVVPTNKKMLVALDVSGSMQSSNPNGFALNPKQIGVMLLTTLMKSEPNVEAIFFTDKLIPCTINRTDSFNSAMEKSHYSGRTDCSIPYQYAIDKKLNLDAIVVLTDNETWAGNKHPLQVAEQYTDRFNKNVKNIIVGMIANKFSLFPDTDQNAMNVVGYSSDLPTIINEFIKN